MKIICNLCEKTIDTKKEDVYVTVRWCFEDLLKLNNIELNKDIGRVINLCSECWKNKLKEKLPKEDYYWTYDREI